MSVVNVSNQQVLLIMYWSGQKSKTGFEYHIQYTFIKQLLLSAASNLFPPFAKICLLV